MDDIPSGSSEPHISGDPGSPHVRGRPDKQEPGAQPPPHGRDAGGLPLHGEGTIVSSVTPAGLPGSWGTPERAATRDAPRRDAGATIAAIGSPRMEAGPTIVGSRLAVTSMGTGPYTSPGLSSIGAVSNAILLE